jgi:precorrin-6A/cobalt-precorrin-6A reductase
MPEHRLLILGGTGEAAALAQAASARFGERLAVTSSLAGRTARPQAPAGRVRLGGFGGAAGLTDYLAAEAVDFLIDATHPFAATISRHARLAAAVARVPRLMLVRPPWAPVPGDRWIGVPDLAAAAATAATLGRRIFLTVGATELAAFGPYRDARYLVRLVDRPDRALPLEMYDLVIARGPFALADERALLARHRIDALVCKASGGAATEAKLTAAREAGLPVVMVDRPPPEPGEAVGSVQSALEWLAGRMN